MCLPPMCAALRVGGDVDVDVDIDAGNYSHSSLTHVLTTRLMNDFIMAWTRLHNSVLLSPTSVCLIVT